MTQEPGTDSGRGPDAQGHRRQGAEQVTEIVGRCQPSAVANRYRGILLHHREDRREGEPPDAHCDPEGRESRQRDDQGRGHVLGLRLPQIRMVHHAARLRRPLPLGK
jgi:hypothetical protein